MDSALFESFGWLLTALIIAFVVFLALRQLVLWYFRLNQIADDLAVIAQHYRVLDHNAGVQPAQQPQRVGSPFAPMGNRPNNT